METRHERRPQQTRPSSSCKRLPCSAHHWRFSSMAIPCSRLRKQGHHCHCLRTMRSRPLSLARWHAVLQWNPCPCLQWRPEATGKKNAESELDAVGYCMILLRTGPRALRWREGPDPAGCSETLHRIRCNIWARDLSSNFTAQIWVLLQRTWKQHLECRMTSLSHRWSNDWNTCNYLTLT